MRIKKVSQYIEGGANLSNVYGTSNENGYTQEYINNLHTYSTDEVRIGTWINNKPLYRKTIVYTGITWQFYTNLIHNISNLGEIIKVNGTYKIKSGATRVIPSAFSNNGTLTTNNFYCFIYDISDTNVGVCLSQFVIDSITKMTLTIEYTKTTD